MCCEDGNCPRCEPQNYICESARRMDAFFTKYDGGKAHSVTLEGESDYVHVRLPSGNVICIAGDGTIDLNGIPAELEIA